MTSIPFKIIAKSENANSFGLYQMFAVSQDGTVYKTHANRYHAKERGETIFLTDNAFLGHELTERVL